MPKVPFASSAVLTWSATVPNTMNPHWLGLTTLAKLDPFVPSANTTDVFDEHCVHPEAYPNILCNTSFAVSEMLKNIQLILGRRLLLAYFTAHR